ncbi:hypothetical protein [Streptomyces sp. NPDC047108]|uniref:hypothetical protein n=1 Tax=Streptomyces sp. NPDC047108 TaxID=3155025 RepID=UPI0033CF7A53
MDEFFELSGRAHATVVPVEGYGALEGSETGWWDVTLPIITADGHPGTHTFVTCAPTADEAFHAAIRDAVTAKARRRRRDADIDISVAFVVPRQD